MTRKVSIFIIGLGLIMLAACGPTNTKTAESTDTPVAEAKLVDNQFGEEIDAEGAISYENLLEEMQQKDTLVVKVKGKVEAVCQAKGCWMNIVADNPDAENMMVRFKDYGFFVPKTIAGREAIMQGHAYREITSVEELRHLAQDAGKSPEEIEEISEPKVELKFLASGVLLLDKS